MFQSFGCENEQNQRMGQDHHPRSERREGQDSFSDGHHDVIRIGINADGNGKSADKEQLVYGGYGDSEKGKFGKGDDGDKDADDVGDIVRAQSIRSESARNAVGKILAESGYRNNIHSSAIGLRKGFRLAVAMPDSSRGEYWFSIREGINHALEEFSDIRIDCSFSLYNRNDIHSCREVFGQVSVSDADAVIICATNREETVGMCRCLGNRNIPYFMAGTEIPDTDPVASFSADQEASGRLAARLLSTLSAPPPIRKMQTETSPSYSRSRRQPAIRAHSVNGNAA